MMKEKLKPKCAQCGYQGTRWVTAPWICIFAVGEPENSRDLSPVFQSLKNHYKEERSQTPLSFCPKCGRFKETMEFLLSQKQH